MSKNFTIIGARLVGSLLTIYLAKRGYALSIYERRPDMRKNRISAGRSINLALSDREWRSSNRYGYQRIDTDQKLNDRLLRRRIFKNYWL